MAVIASEPFDEGALMNEQPAVRSHKRGTLEIDQNPWRQARTTSLVDVEDRHSARQRHPESTRVKIFDFTSRAASRRALLAPLRDLLIVLWRLPVLLSLVLFKRESVPAFIGRSAMVLGPVYVKVLQVLSTRIDVLDSRYISAFSRLRDQIPPMPDNALDTALARAFPRGVDRTFASFNRDPVGAGSICQVHAAVLFTGEQVAVKIRRPHVRARIVGSFALLKWIVRLGGMMFRRLKALNCHSILSELEELLIAQTDLTRERSNMERFRDAFSDCSYVYVPRAHADYSSSRALVMEFVEGVSPYEYHALDLSPLQLAERVDDLQDMMNFVKGLCHADLHPGNFYWTQEGKLILMDFGLVHEVSRDQRSHLLTFYTSVLDGYYEFATNYFLKHFVGGGHASQRAQAIQEISAIVSRHWAESGGRPQFAEMFAEILDVLSRSRLALKAEYSPLLLTLVTLEGYVYSLDPSFDMLENYRRKRLNAAEYADVPEEAERAVLGSLGTYSVAMFSGATSPDEAYLHRNEFVERRLDVDPGDVVIDVGCGRGWLLERLKARGVRGIGITMSRTEHEACAQKGLQSVWSSWERADEQLAGLPPAAAISGVEVVLHLASLHECKEGLLDERLRRLFAWCHLRLREQGVLFLQVLNIREDFLSGRSHPELFRKTCESLPWMGFSTLRQITENARPCFEIEEIQDGTSDLLPTYRYWDANRRLHEAKLRRLIKPRTYDLLCRELDMLLELSDRNLLSLNRVTLRKVVSGTKANLKESSPFGIGRSESQTLQRGRCARAA